MTRRTTLETTMRIALSLTLLAWASPALVAADEHEQHEKKKQTQHRARHGHEAGHTGGCEQCGHFLDRHADALDLDDETRKSIEGIVSKSGERSKKLAESRREAEQTLRALMSSDAVDRAAVMRQVDAVGAIELAQRKHRVTTKLDVRAQLTPEQRKQLDERRKSAKAERHHGKCKGKGQCKHAGPDGKKCKHGDACPRRASHGDAGEDDDNDD